MRTRSGRVFGRFVHIESKNRTSASFCYLANIDIFQNVTQCSTCTGHITLYFIMSRIPYNVEEVHVYINVTIKECVHQARLAQSVEALTTNLNVFGFKSHCGQDFHFVFICFPRAPRKLTEPIQMTSSMIFIQGTFVIGA